jgi:hypothetical protein
VEQNAKTRNGRQVYLDVCAYFQTTTSQPQVKCNAPSASKGTLDNNTLPGATCEDLTPTTTLANVADSSPFTLPSELQAHILPLTPTSCYDVIDKDAQEIMVVTYHPYLRDVIDQDAEIILIDNAFPHLGDMNDEDAKKISDTLPNLDLNFPEALFCGKSMFLLQSLPP